MRFFLANDVPDRIGHVLTAEGHDVAFLRHVMPRVAPDEEVLNVAASHRRVVLTCNRDDFLRLLESSAMSTSPKRAVQAYLTREQFAIVALCRDTTVERL